MEYLKEIKTFLKDMTQNPKEKPTYHQNIDFFLWPSRLLQRFENLPYDLGC